MPRTPPPFRLARVKPSRCSLREQLLYDATKYFSQGPDQCKAPSAGPAMQGAELQMVMGKLLPQRFTTATGLTRGSATLIAGQVLANDEASEPTRIRKTRVLLVGWTVD